MLSTVHNRLGCNVLLFQDRSVEFRALYKQLEVRQKGNVKLMVKLIPTNFRTAKLGHKISVEK